MSQWTALLGCRGVAVACALMLPAADTRAGDPTPPTPEPPMRFSDSVSVERVLMNVRILDAQGKAIRDLSANDIRATVDGHPIAIESLQWIDVTTPTVVPEGAVEPVAAGRSLVFLFQKDVTGTRAAGLLRMASRAREVVDSLPAPDRVAVVSFDTHLRLWQDFTADRARVKQAIDRGVLMNRALPRAVAAGASLEALVPPEAARRAYTLEKALALLGTALVQVPGERSLVLVGSHMGRGPTVLLAEEYQQAQQALVAARVAVYALDVTEADHHTLEAGLQQVAADTGGFYARTHDFTAQAVDRLKGALEGHYLLTFAKPPGPSGYHEVKLHLARGGATVLAHGGYAD